MVAPASPVLFPTIEPSKVKAEAQMAAKASQKTNNRLKRRIFLVDDHPVLREGLTRLINHQADMEVCGQTGTAAKALGAIAGAKPDLVVVDLTLRGGGGLELIKNIRAVHGDMAILALSMHDEVLYAERVLRAGARGYVMKQAPTEEVMSAIRQVLRGKRYLSQKMHDRLLGKAGGEALRSAGRELEQLS